MDHAQLLRPITTSSSSERAPVITTMWNDVQVLPIGLLYAMEAFGQSHLYRKRDQDRHMKIPLAHEPFAPVTLSHDQEEQLKWLSNALLEETLVENDEFIYCNNRALDKNVWKQVITRENVVIYKRRGKEGVGGCTPDVNLFESDHEPRSRYWRLPLCVGVGTLTGSLDDLLYGVLAPSALEYKVRTSYTKDDIVDSRVLATILHPTESEPMRLMCVRWALLSQAVHKVVVPRDLVHLDSMGTRILPNGERIGFIVHQSIDLPGCGDLKHLGLVRATYSMCYLFRDTGGGAIEIYMRAYMDSGGKLPDGIAVFSGALALISIWRMMLAGQNKKLAYMVRTNFTHKGLSDVFAKAKEDNTKNCPLCLKTMSSIRAHTRCDLCQTKMCSRCVDKRKLTHIQGNGRLVRVPTRICKACITIAMRLNAADVATSEQVPGSSLSIRLNSSSSNTAASSSTRSQLHQSPNHMMWHHHASSYLRQSSDTITSDSTAQRGPRVYSYSDSLVSVPDSNCWTFTSVPYSDASSSVSIRDSDVSLPSPDSCHSIPSADSMEGARLENEANVRFDRTQFDLWARMNQLQIAAEETDMVTQENVAIANAASNQQDVTNTMYPPFQKTL